MPTRAQSLEVFSKNMDELITSPYVLSTVKISNLLKGVATSKMLCDLFAFCVGDFDYETQKGDYLIKGERTGEGKFVFPPDQKTFIALAFSLLYSVDLKVEDLMNILGNYFYAPDLDSAYKNFCARFLAPFKEEVLSALKKMIEGEAAAPAAKVSAATDKALGADDLKEIDALLDQSKSVILQYKIEPELKAELVVLYDNFKQAIFDNEAKKLKVAFLGYKYAALFHRRLDVSVEKIENILKKANVIQ